MIAHLTHMHSSGRAASQENIYVSGGIPAEVVEVSKERGKGFRCGRLISVCEASPHRVSPFCLLHNLCGGCPWQQMDYPTQLHWKRDILCRALEKYEIPLPSDGVREVIGSPLKLYYRNKTEYTFEAQGQRMGYHSLEDGTSVTDCSQCYLLPKGTHEIALRVKEIAIDQAIPFYRYSDREGLLRNLLIRTSRKGDCCLTLGFTAHKEDVILPFMERLKTELPAVTSWYYSIWEALPEKKFYDPDFYHFSGQPYIEETIEGTPLRFTYLPQAFYQPNPTQADALYAHIVSLARLWEKDRPLVFDLYSGIGTIISALAQSVEKPRRSEAQWVAIEGNPQAVKDARRNALANELPFIEYMNGDILQTFTQEFISRYRTPELVVLDPPRSGTLTEIKKALLAARPRQIIYVSCNPVSLAWDLKMLCEKGYRPVSIQPFDMFPHTQHVETVVHLEQEPL